MRLEWSSASRALPGMAQMGDVTWVREWDGGARVAVIDGLGHGQEAAAAADLAKRCLQDLAGGALEAAFAALDQALRRSRGAAISMMELDLENAGLAWAGVGNVEASLLRARDLQKARERMLVQSGIVGARLPRLQVRRLSLEPGDWLLFHTDGVDSLDARDLKPLLSPQENAEHLLAVHARPSDDALIWLGKVHGNG